MLNHLTSALLQLVGFSLIPFLVFLIKKKTVKGFFDWIGLKKSNRKANSLAFLIMLVSAAPLITLSWFNKDFWQIMTDPNSITGQFRAQGLGVNSVVSLLIVALLKTSFTEEVFFRGFVAKRLIAVTNFRTGNIIQAVIFGMIHTLIFLSITDNALFLIIIFLFPAITSYFKVYLNEKVAHGSIIPGWIAHATANVVAYSTIGFIL